MNANQSKTLLTFGNYFLTGNSEVIGSPVGLLTANGASTEGSSAGTGFWVPAAMATYHY